MPWIFYVAAGIAVAATAMTITRLNPVHALLYLVVSLLAVAVVFYTLGAPFIAALEVIIYAGAIMVLFVFVVMMLNLGERGLDIERRWLTRGIWVGPVVLAAVLLVEVFFLVTRGPEPSYTQY
jgi:NADH-quinone oxidoreductase subunit J